MKHNVVMMKVNIIEATHDKFNELTALGIIVRYDDARKLIYIDRDKLSNVLGYTLVVDCGRTTCTQPMFKQLTDIYYSMNEILYLSDVIPYESLMSYVLNDVRSTFTSF